MKPSWKKRGALEAPMGAAGRLWYTRRILVWAKTGRLLRAPLGQSDDAREAAFSSQVQQQTSVS